jgi:PucR family transcriptional regulator, purine catabolism regulatory protein
VTKEKLVEFAERLSQIAASGGGPKALAAHLAAAIGSNVLLEDLRWHRLAAAGTGDTPASARATVEGGGPGRSIQVVAGGAHVGWLSVFGNGAPPSETDDTLLDVELLMRLTGAAIGIELMRLPDTARGRRADFWERLIGRTHHDSNAARDDAVASGLVLAAAYLTVALEREAGDESERSEDPGELRAIAAEAFRSGDADLGFLERGATLLIFVPAAREVDASNARTAAGLLPKATAKRTTPLRLTGGVGTVETPLALHQSVDAALGALAIGRRVFGAGRVASYDDLGAYPLLYEGADVRHLQAFARRVLTPLRAYDEKHQTELERTLRLFFEVGQNVKTAAAKLNVHRHTVVYRLRQIGEICACTLESSHDQLTLRLAVAIDALHSS